MTATVRPVSPRPRGEVTPAQRRRLDRVFAAADKADAAKRAEVVAVLAEGASFAEVSSATGLSKTTLLKWKQDATP